MSIIKTVYRAAHLTDDGKYVTAMSPDVPKSEYAEQEAVLWKKSNPRFRYAVFSVTTPGGELTFIKEITL